MDFNADETHVVFEKITAKTLEMKEDENVKFADVVSGGEGMTMMVKISGACDAQIRPPFLIFQNVASSYPILGCPDDVSGACYLTGPRGWME